MSERITETTNLGNAFLAQEGEVMDMVQELRAKAYAQGNLTTNSEQKVIVEKETIVIEPAAPRVIYVPYYDPFYIYGPWWYPAYLPYYWVPPGVSIGIGISYWPGFYFGFAFCTWSYFDWHHHYVFIDVDKRPRYVRHDRWIPKPGRWHHAPRHRRGVAYRDKSTARKYGQYPYRSRDFRRDTRGFPELRDQDRRVNDRTRIDRDKGGDDRSRIDRYRQERERVDREKQQRERVEREWKERQSADRDKQIRERANRDRQVRQRADQEREARQRVEGKQQERERVEREQQMRQPADQERQARQRVDGEQQQRSRENVFNRVEDGMRERQSSERGRVSRKGRGDGSRGTGRSGGDDGGGREDWGRNRR